MVSDDFQNRRGFGFQKNQKNKEEEKIVDPDYVSDGEGSDGEIANPLDK